MKPDTPCTDCGKLLYRGPGSLPNPTCRDCRRSRRLVDSADAKAAHEARRKARVLSRKSQVSDVPCLGCRQVLTIHQIKEGQRYCSRSCFKRRRNSKGLCKNCGQGFWTKRDRTTYCSDECRVEAIRRPLSSRWVCYLTYSNCQVCGTLICWKSLRVYCSEACTRKGAARLAYQRNPERFKRAAHRRRARIKKAFVDDVDATKVYERDKWMCHICGKKVRKSPRFPRDPEMASLDHLIPLDQQGAHSYANVACSHLRCNLRKHTSATGEQLMIVGMT